MPPKTSKRPAAKTKKTEPMKSLPPAEPHFLLPAPKRHTIILCIVALLPVLVVLLYALYPWFSLSGVASRNLVLEATFLFIIGLAVLAVYIAKLFYDLLMRKTEAVEKDKHIIGLMIFFSFTIMFFSAVLFLIQP
ncbi:MAG: hypothetical protein WCT27_04760 [Patescibacteria group bacterium]|jgi:hypothetical protein